MTRGICPSLNLPGPAIRVYRLRYGSVKLTEYWADSVPGCRAIRRVWPPPRYALAGKKIGKTFRLVGASKFLFVRKLPDYAGVAAYACTKHDHSCFTFDDAYLRVLLARVLPTGVIIAPSRSVMSIRWRFFSSSPLPSPRRGLRYTSFPAENRIRPGCRRTTLSRVDSFPEMVICPIRNRSLLL